MNMKESELNKTSSLFVLRGVAGKYHRNLGVMRLSLSVTVPFLNPNRSSEWHS